MASTCPVPESAGAGGEESVAKTTESKAGAEDELPKLSAADFRAYNRLAVMMDAYVGFSLLTHFFLLVR